MEAKYKVGDVVTGIGMGGPMAISHVVPCYKFTEHGLLWAENELTPYVEPIKAGDKVRGKVTGRETTVVAVCDGMAWVKGEGPGWIEKFEYLERIDP